VTYQGADRRKGNEAILAEHGAHIGQLRADVAELKAELKHANETLGTISLTLAQAQGGWKVAVGLGGLAAAGGGSLVAIIMNAWQHIKP
jgi:ribosome-interacting GTPase 1